MTKMGQKKTKAKSRKGKVIKLYPLDIMFSKYIRAMSEFTCEYCGAKPKNPQGLHCSHFIGRRYRNTRWLEDNVACLCFGCHNLMHDFPAIHKEFFVKRLGSDAIEKLEILARSGVKPDLELIKEKLAKKLKAVGL